MAHEQPAGRSCSWGCLPAELLALVFDQLSNLAHEGKHGGLTGLGAAVQLLAAASPNRHWRSVAVTELCFQLRLASAAQVRQLAVAPIRCRKIQLPKRIESSGILTIEHLEAHSELVAAAQQLLGSETFRRNSGNCLAVLHSCPLAAAPRLLDASFTALQHLSAYHGLGAQPGVHAARLQRFPPTLRQLELTVPSLEAAGHLPWPATLELCSIQAYDAIHEWIKLAPCSCAGCCGAGGFWGTCRALHLAAASGRVHLDMRNASFLRSCDSVKLSAKSVCIVPPFSDMEQGWAAPAGPLSPLQWWLHALAPTFAATPLQLFQVEAAAAMLVGFPGTLHSGYIATPHRVESLHGLTAELTLTAGASRPSRSLPLRLRISRAPLMGD